VACRRLAEHPSFDRSIVLVVLANAAVLGASTYVSLERAYGGVLDALNSAFLVVFVVELAIRFLAVGANPRRFFSSGWNVFDFVVIGAAFVPGLAANSTLLRLARLARVIRVVRLLPDLRVLIVAVGRALPGVGSLAVLTLLFLFVYGMVGWVIFDSHDPERFGNIGSAMLNLFVMLSLENLPDNLEMGRELSEWTVVYFVSFALLAAFLLFNLFIGIVINSMEEARALELARAEGSRKRRDRPRARADRAGADPEGRARRPRARARPAGRGAGERSTGAKRDSRLVLLLVPVL
jgi:voltage-gated sodium channel